MTWFLGQVARDCKGTTWAGALRGWDGLSLVAADAGAGLQAGIATVVRERQEQGKPSLEIRLLHDNGLRCGEASGLDVADVDLDRLKVSIVGKGKTSREELTINKATGRAIAEWLAHRGKEAGPLFLRMSRPNALGEWSGNAEDEAIVEACRSMGLDRESTAYAAARNRRLPGLLGYVTMMGGDAGDWVRRMMEARGSGE